MNQAYNVTVSLSLSVAQWTDAVRSNPVSTQGARGFSCAVSGVGQVFGYPVSDSECKLSSTHAA